MKDDFKPYRPKLAFVPVQAGDTQSMQTQEEDQEPSFVPPELLAEQEESVPSKQPQNDVSTMPESPNKHQNNPTKYDKSIKQRHSKSDKQKKIIFIGITICLLAASAGLVWWFVIRSTPKPAPQPVVQKEDNKEAPKPTTIASRLTGVQIQPELNDLPATGVMIENSPDARPQSGLQEAGVVYEAIAEGGITRFLAVYLESKPAAIGPVRSVRPYYLDFLAPYDAPLAHAGGSGEALAQLSSQGFKDLEAFQNANYYQRVTSRYAPHNLYTSRDKLLELQNAKGWNKSTFTGFARKGKEEPSTTPTARAIDFKISGYFYNPHFDYDAATNSYPRTLAGKPHSDEKTGNRIAPKVVIAIVTSHRYAGIYSVYGMTGSGTAYIFQDGTVTKGIWEKPSRKDQFRFGDANGAPLGLNAGQTWVSLVSSNEAVTFTP